MISSFDNYWAKQPAYPLISRTYNLRPRYLKESLSFSRFGFDRASLRPKRWGFLADYYREANVSGYYLSNAAREREEARLGRFSTYYTPYLRLPVWDNELDEKTLIHLAQRG